ncbi:tetraacyldisaccharide 4'-kinase [Magnetospira thiophila]
MRPPDFWFRAGFDFRSWALAPLAALFTLAGRRRRARCQPQKVSVPVLCIGNLSLGGAGKTPVALAVAQRLHLLGGRPHFLTRGYKGREKGPLRVDPRLHRAADVGDEPLLLARVAPTWVAAERPAGAEAAIAAGATHLILDDGFQNPSLHQDLALLVVDGGIGFGNERVVPAGPLREPVSDGLARAQGVVLIGYDRCAVADQIGDLALHRAHFRPLRELDNRNLLAFAGIGRPEKFFATLRNAGGKLVATRGFADHYPYTEADIRALLREAAAVDATLITTAKDAVRLPPSLRDAVQVLEVDLSWEDELLLDDWLKTGLGI